MTFNKQLVDRILDTIESLPYHFGLYYDVVEENYKCPFEKIIQKKLQENINSSIEIYSGASKLIISPNQEDFVIKIPFNGYYYTDLKGNGCWKYFKMANCSNPANYCLAEFEKYQKLKELNLDCFVAETAFYKYFSGVPIYIQEKIISINNMIELPVFSQDSLALVKKIESKKETKTGLNIDWLANCVDYYGIDKVKNFIDYCNKIDYDILEDAHESNYGYRLSNLTPAFLDYSNYMD